MMQALAILGTCGSARETYWVIRERYPDCSIVFVDDANELRELDMSDKVVPVVKDWNFAPYNKEGREFRYFIPGMGTPKVKKVMVKKALERGLMPGPSVVSRYAAVRPDCRLGAGCVVHATSWLTSRVTAGDFVTIHSAVVGHDTVLKDYVTCAAGSTVLGHVILEEGVYLGAGTVVRDHLRIAADVMTGMQTCVAKSITEPGITVLGVPARRLVPHGV